MQIIQKKGLENINTRRMVVFILVILFSGIAACDSSPETSAGPDSTTTSAQPVPPAELRHEITGCYMRALQRDTLVASFAQYGKNVTGKLTFDNYQKDGSTGTVTGTVEGDIIKLVYRFHSEGMNSISEVYFKITPDGLVHGYGDVEVKGDSAYYADEAGIRYNEMEKWFKLPCEDIPGKYR